MGGDLVRRHNWIDPSYAYFAVAKVAEESASARHKQQNGKQLHHRGDECLRLNHAVAAALELWNGLYTEGAGVVNTWSFEEFERRLACHKAGGG